MVSIRRAVDRWFALGLAFSPVYVVGEAAGVDTSTAWAAAVVALTAVAPLLLAYGPSHDSSDAWRGGIYTALSFGALSFGAGRAGYRLGDHLVGALAVWVAAIAVALALVARRRGWTPAP